MGSFLYLELFDPPVALLASGSKKGVDLGGSKSLLSIDQDLNLYNEGNIVTEMSWGTFYDIEGLEDQIDTFTTKEYNSLRDDPEALIKAIIRCLEKLMKENKLFYGIADLEVDAFMNQNTVIPGLKLDSKLINKLMDTHKKQRDENLFPTLIKGDQGQRSIKISFQGENKKNLHFYGLNYSELSSKLLAARGFATGIVATSDKAANFFLMNDNIRFKENKPRTFYIDQDCITVIEANIQREKLFPISWFRIDIGLFALRTLELWEEIKDDKKLTKILSKYVKYCLKIVKDLKIEEKAKKK
ncbi:MAG: hypothetical protein JW891_16305 [Candidatus Lokiarchaeota archaeon]|nr:hypothetical protein [Candidatus Lokiarchaeota archaeon]